MTMAVAGLLYLGMFALAAGMSRHADPLLGPQAKRAALRHPARPGWALVALSFLVACLAGDGGRALVLWFGLIPFVSAIILLGLTYRPAVPRAVVPVAMLMVLLAPFTWAVNP
ncbi:MAG: DUF3325 domain-containing protein [Sphingomonas sp.]|uniref:DUF3325 family protein n=1 Tax=unclassified Sphingomonas TaxID=196159 RepID=UPI0024567AAE|nr:MULTISPECIES: DUF3325 family protein [unclassified Sphingomonas]MBQ1500255.1 DUF3325 domain-containing protein [Sphingomonas sp.]MDH4744120.1 DUF3325 domain-containing protein [Sphingomonas sp. CBMAI 2297]